MDSYFEPGIKLEGKLWIKGIVHFDAELEGEVCSTNLFIVGKKGKVLGDIKTYEVTNMGKVIGNIYAENKVSLAGESSLIGDISTFNLIIDEGSSFDGSCKMIDGPPKEIKVESLPSDPEPPKRQKGISFKGISFKGISFKRISFKRISFPERVRWNVGVLIFSIFLVAVGLGIFYPILAIEKQDTLLSQGYSLLEKNELATAEEVFRKALKTYSKDPQVHAGLGEVYFSKNQFTKAIGFFQKSIKLNPSESSYHIKLAKALGAEGQLKKAKSTYKMVINIDPTNSQAFFGLGKIQVKENAFDKAIANLIMAVKLNSNFYESH